MANDYRAKYITYDETKLQVKVRILGTRKRADEVNCHDSGVIYMRKVNYGTSTRSNDGDMPELHHICKTKSIYYEPDSEGMNGSSYTLSLHRQRILHLPLPLRTHVHTGGCVCI